AVCAVRSTSTVMARFLLSILYGTQPGWRSPASSWRRVKPLLPVSTAPPRVAGFRSSSTRSVPMFRSHERRTFTHTTNSHSGSEDALHTLGDFTTTRRVLVLSVLATGIGVLSAFVALALLRLIGLCTNLFFFQRWDTELVSPAGHTLGLFVVLVPIIGALI